MKIEVDADALRALLVALNGPGHLVRELIVIAGLPLTLGDPTNPIGTLVKQYNDAVNEHNKQERKQLTDT